MPASSPTRWPYDIPTMKGWQHSQSRGFGGANSFDRTAELARANAALTAANTALTAADTEIAASQAAYDALDDAPATDTPPGALELYLRNRRPVEDRHQVAITIRDLRRAQVADAQRHVDRVTDAIALAGA
jgi:hypothetical protein